jgi:hypothetical protein
MYTIFKVINTSTNQTYYGYSHGEDLDVAKEQFYRNANGSNQLRGDVRVRNNCGTDVLVFEVYDVCDSETEAHIIRNEARVADIDSVSGPTAWPIEVHEVAIKEFEDRAKQIYNKQQQLHCKTARKAYSMGLWTGAQIQSLLKSFSHKTIAGALDELTPIEFSRHYQPYMLA